MKKKTATTRTGIAVSPKHLAPLRHFRRVLTGRLGRRVSLSLAVGTAAQIAVRAERAYRRGQVKNHGVRHRRKRRR